MICRECGRQRSPTNMETLGYATVFSVVGFLLYFVPDWLIS